MTKKRDPGIVPDPQKGLRASAEARLGKTRGEVKDGPSLEEARGLIHELQVHQVELEMQNEELRCTQEKLEAERQRFFDLYDMAPLGYCTLDPDGLIAEANILAATLLGVPRGGLVKQSLTRFIKSYGQDAFYLFGKLLLEKDEPRVLDLRMVRADGSEFWGKLESGRVRAADGTLVRHIVLSDITERRQAEIINEQNIRLLHDELEQRVAERTEGLRQANLALEEEIAERKSVERQMAELNQTLEQRVVERTVEVVRLADQLRALASELTRAEQHERQRVAVILHDHVQQLLVGAHMQVKRAANPDPDIARSSLKEADSFLREALAATRSLTVELFPPVLSQMGLGAAIEWLVRDWEEKYQFVVRLEIDFHAEPENPEMRVFLYNAVREVLLNAEKHSGVRKARLVMERTKDNQCRITIEDQGRGFLPKLSDPGPIGGFGLFSIQQRLMYFGGMLEIESAPHQGTRISLNSPIVSPLKAWRHMERDGSLSASHSGCGSP